MENLAGEAVELVILGGCVFGRLSGNFLENGESFLAADIAVFLFQKGENLLMLGEFIQVEVVLDFIDAAVVVAEEAAFAVGAVELAHEGVAGLGLVLNVDGLGFVD